MIIVIIALTEEGHDYEEKTEAGHDYKKTEEGHDYKKTEEGRDYEEKTDRPETITKRRDQT